MEREAALGRHHRSYGVERDGAWGRRCIGEGGCCKPKEKWGCSICRSMLNLEAASRATYAAIGTYKGNNEGTLSRAERVEGEGWLITTYRG